MNEDCFTPKVLEADCDNTPITFLTTEIEGVDDIKNPPLNGAYNNTIVKYLMTNNVYLYNSVGIPTLLNPSRTMAMVDDKLSLESVNPVENKVITEALNKGTEDLQNETEAREAAIAALQDLLNTKVDKVSGKGLSTKDYTAQDQINLNALMNFNNDNDVIIGNSSTADRAPKYVSDNSGVEFQYTRGTISGSFFTTSSIALPVASAFNAGVMTSAMYNTLQEASDVAIRFNKGSVVVSDLPENPTKFQLNAAWINTSGLSDPFNGAKIYDVTNKKDWTYYSSIGEWVAVAVITN